MEGKIFALIVLGFALVVGAAITVEVMILSHLADVEGPYRKPHFVEVEKALFLKA